jgi:hypothetical protein
MLPKDMIPLIWGYEADHPFEKQCSIIQSTGLEYYVCPGTSTWDAITGRTKNAMSNLLNAAKAGKLYNANGFLNTNWGDYGNWQPISVYYPEFIYGAAVSWNVKGNSDIDIAFLLDQWVFQDRAGLIGQIILDLGNLYTLTGVKFQNQSVLFTSLRDIEKSLSEDENFKRLTLKGLERVDSSIVANISKLNKSKMVCADADQVFGELLNAVAMYQHASRVIRDKLVSGDGTMNHISETERQFLIQDISRIIANHRELWVKRDRIGGLQSSTEKLEKILMYYQHIQGK